MQDICHLSRAESSSSCDESNIFHSTNLSCILSKLCLKEELADITIIIDGERIPAHCLILAARSEYFRALLYGGFSESKTNEIHLNVNLEAFKVILKYIYLGTLDVSSYEDNLLISTLHLASGYDFLELLDSLYICFYKRLNLTNVLMFANVACLYKFTILLEKCFDFIDKNIEIFFHPCVFKESISKELISQIISRDSFSVEEWRIFEAIVFWSKDKLDSDIKYVLTHVRFTLLQIDQIRLDVVRTNLLSPDEIDIIIRDIKTLKKLPFRLGEIHRNQFDSNLIEVDKSYVLEGCFGELGFVLTKKETVNFFKFSFNGDLNSKTTFNIEVSIDQREWTRICTKKSCSVRKYYFHFAEQEVKYIFIEFDDRKYELKAEFELKYDILKYYRGLDR